jgi:hypothetical protein
VGQFYLLVDTSNITRILAHFDSPALARLMPLVHRLSLGRTPNPKASPTSISSFGFPEAVFAIASEVGKQQTTA